MKQNKVSTLRDCNAHLLLTLFDLEKLKKVTVYVHASFCIAVQSSCHTDNYMMTMETTLTT